MSKFHEALELYKVDADKHGISPEFLAKVAKGLGPSIYNKDSSLVSGGDPEELSRVKTNFLIKKLGLTDSPELDKAIDEVVEQMGRSNRNKHRAVFYAILAKKFGKESIYA